MTYPPTNPPKFLSKPNELGIIAVGFSGGQGKPGVDAAPTALINAGLLTQLYTDLHYTVHHDNTVHTYTHLQPAHDPPHRGMKNPRAVSAVTRALSEQVYEHASQGRLVLTLGGDHSIAIGTIAGMSRAVRERFPHEAGTGGAGEGGGGGGGGGGEVGVIWVDAHADINTPESSGSGNVHGMPVAWLTGLAQQQQNHPNSTHGGTTHDSSVVTNGNADEEPFAWLPTTPPPLALKNLVYIALRDVDPGEKEILRQYGVKAFSMHDIDKHGIGPITSAALSHLPPHLPLHLSFDVDALDPQWAPSTGTPVRGGLTLREGDFIAESVWATGRCVGVDLVEVNPAIESRDGKGAAEDTIRTGVSLVRCALGDTLL